MVASEVSTSTKWLQVTERQKDGPTLAGCVMEMARATTSRGSRGFKSALPSPLTRSAPSPRRASLNKIGGRARHIQRGGVELHKLEVGEAAPACQAR